MMPGVTNDAVHLEQMVNAITNIILFIRSGYFKVLKGCSLGGHPGCAKSETDTMSIECYCNDKVTLTALNATHYVHIFRIIATEHRQ
jgi:hypothetical protein